MNPFDNDFFEEDPFESIVKEFFGARPEVNPDIRRYREKVERLRIGF